LPQVKTAVYYVGPNVLGLEKRYAFRPRDFRLWIAIHEVTHRAQFTAVPWMKPYYLSLVDSALVSRTVNFVSGSRRTRAPASRGRSWWRPCPTQVGTVRSR
jgi:uncharacterized protein (DUF2342 family)